MKKILSTLIYFIFITNIFSQDLDWAFNIGTNNTSEEVGRSIELDASGNIYLVGDFQSTADFNPDGATANNLISNGSLDIFIAKYNSSGAYQWAINIGGSDLDIVYDVTLDASSNIYIVGKFTGTADFNPDVATTNNLTSSGSSNLFLAKYNSNGVYQWAVNFPNSTGDVETNIEIDASHIYLVGTFGSTTDFNPDVATTNNLSSSGSIDIFVAKYDLNAVYQWAFKIGSTGDENTVAVALDASSNIYIAAKFSGSADVNPDVNTVTTINTNGDSDILVAKYNSSGVYQWAFTVGGTGHDTPSDIMLDGSGNIYVTGGFGSTVDFNPDENTTNSLTTSAFVDIFIAKYNNSGAYQWAHGMTGGTFGFGGLLQMDNTSNIYLGGVFFGTADFNPDVATTNSLTASSSPEIFMAKYTNNGDYIDVFQLGVNELKDLELDASSNILLTGSYSGTVDFDPAPSTTTNLSTSSDNSNTNVFLAQYKSSALPVEMTYFKGVSKDEHTLLTWQTASEINNDGFEIQRAACLSCLGRQVGSLEWENIGFVSGTGTTTETTTYDFKDYQPNQGINYYRLKQIDFDGKFEYSSIVNIEYRTRNIEYRIFPNPVVCELNVVNAQGQASIFNTLGQPVKSFKIQSRYLSGSPFKIDTKDLPSGQYILQIESSDGKLITKQFVK